MKNYLKYFYPYDWLVLGYTLFSIILSAFFDFRIDYGIVFQYKYDIAFIELLVLYLIIFVSFMALKYRREGKDDFICGKYWRKSIVDKFLHWKKLLDLLRVLILLKLTLLIYCNIKQAIPFINPVLYDSELLFADKILHLGFNPNKLCLNILGADFISVLIDRIYFSWYILKPLVIAYFVIIPEKRIHVCFFTSYFALWIFGGLFAVLVPSLGPIYAYPVWFKNLKMPYAAILQKRLLVHYNAALADPDAYKAFIYEGIAAFPSLHVGVVALFSFFIWKVNRIVGIIMLIYTLLIQIGSVLLGWHYAVDGYFGILLAWLLYKTSQFYKYKG